MQETGDRRKEKTKTGSCKHTRKPSRKKTGKSGKRQETRASRKQETGNMQESSNRMVELEKMDRKRVGR